MAERTPISYCSRGYAIGSGWTAGCYIWKIKASNQAAKILYSNIGELVTERKL